MPSRITSRCSIQSGQMPGVLIDIMVLAMEFSGIAVMFLKEEYSKKKITDNNAD